MSPVSFASISRAARARVDLVVRGLLAGAHTAALLWFAPITGLPLDDAWIHQVVGRTFAESGTLGYAPGQHGAAATSYLWAALLAVNFKWLHLDPVKWAFGLNALAIVVTGQLLFALFRRTRPEGIGETGWTLASFGAALVACAGPNVIWFAHSGMEASPLLALSAAAVWAATDTRAKSSGARALASGVASGLLALLRPEALPLGFLLAAYVLVRQRDVRRFARIAVPWALAVAAYAGSNLSKTGHVSPSTLAGRRWLWFGAQDGLGRADLALEHVDLWIKRLGTYTVDTSDAVMWILVAIAAFGAIALVRLKNDGVRLLFGWAAAHGLFYVLLLPTPGHGGRYQPFVPVLFTACLVIGAALILCSVARLFSARTSFGPWAVAATAAVLAMTLPARTRLREAHVLAVRHIDGTELGAGAWVDGLPRDALVASFDIGGIGYATRRPILDLGGLSDPAAATLLASGRIREYLEQKGVRYLVLPEGPEHVLPVHDNYAARLDLRDDSRIHLEPVRVFETPFEKWRPAIEATWNSATRQVVYRVEYTKKPAAREDARDAVRNLVAPSSSATSSFADPAHAVPRRDRLVAERALAVLEANGLPVHVRYLVAEEPPMSTDEATCTVSLGPWGIDTSGCKSVADVAVLRAMLFEDVGRYLDIDDRGGAVRVVPHVLARARRLTDATFHPVLAPLAHPIPGGTPEEPFGARAWGLPLFLLVLAATLAFDRLAPRIHGLVRSAARLGHKLPLIALLLPACAADADLSHAIPQGRGAVVDALARGARVDTHDGAGRTPLLVAAEGGDPEIISVLVARGARPDASAGDGSTALHAAARRGCSACLAALTGSAKSVDGVAGPRKRTALHEAAIAGSVDSVSTLLRAGANPNVKDSFGHAALHFLAWIDPARSSAIAPRLLEKGADPRATDGRGFTAAHVAAMSGNTALLRVLLAADGELARSRTPTGDTPLDVAIRYQRDVAAELLFEHGAPVAAGSSPPLHEAARMDAIERAASLVASGTDVTRLFEGKTALDVARENGSARVELLLRPPVTSP